MAGASVIVRRKGLAPERANGADHADAQGRYRSPALVTGDYTVEAWPSGSSSNLIRVMFGGRVCTLSGCPMAEGEPVRVTEPGQTSPIDLALPLGGDISGIVTDAVSGEPLGHVLVTADSGSFSQRAVSTLDGKYSIRGWSRGCTP